MFISPGTDLTGIAKIVNGQLDNDNFRLLPPLALNKLATGALPTGITVASANIVDGTIVNADISNSAAIAISKTTLGTFTNWTTWNDTNLAWAGFSVSPTTTSAYCQIGNIVFMYIVPTINGTSNATTLTFALPIAPIAGQRFGAWAIDNGVTPTAMAEIRLGAGSTSVNCYKTFAGGAWTNAGEKAIFVNLMYHV